MVLWGVSFGDPGPYKPQFEGARSYFDQLVSFSRIVTASYVPDLIGPYLWKSGLYVAILSRFGAFYSIGAGRLFACYLHDTTLWLLGRWLSNLFACWPSGCLAG